MTLHFRQGADAYDITIARGALSQAGELFKLDRKVLVVTGEGVPPQYADTLLSQCSEGFLLTVPEGEANKTLASVELILEALLEHGFTRSDAVVAVGGGVVGDTAGFAAACYMRGIDWYNVPTTLLSQADSSVGGKTGVNLHGVKNIVGAFRQPAGVLIDPDTLDTLSPRLFSEGLAEIIKMAATSDAELFRLLESADDIRPIMEVVLAAALCIKIAVVEADPTEHGLRAVLNFGHTIGHPLEGAANRLTTTIPLHPQGTRGGFPLDPSVGPADLRNFAGIQPRNTRDAAPIDFVAGSAETSRQSALPLREALRRPAGEWRGIVVNDFEATVCPRHPQIQAKIDDFYGRGAVYAAMSGSGSAVFGLFPRK